MDRNIFPLILQARWAMLPEAFHRLITFAEKTVNSPELVAVAQATRKEPLLQKIDVQQSTAIIPVMGPIFSQENIFTLLFGGTAISTLAGDFESAMQNRAIDRVILVFDSPGGDVTGISEMAQRIYTARNQKKIVSYVYGMAASAAYWLASAASKVVMADTAQVGSIGVVAGYTDTRRRDEAAGLSRIQVVSSQSPKKNPDLTTDAGKAEVQRIVDQLADIFVNSVAKYRGMTTGKVLSDFGKGGISIGKNAVNVGMADEVNSLNGLLSGKSGVIAGGMGNSGQKAITTIEQLREIAGASVGFIPIFNKAEEPESASIDRDGEEMDSVVSGIVAGMNQGKSQVEPVSMTDEERRRRYRISMNR